MMDGSWISAIDDEVKITFVAVFVCSLMQFSFSLTPFLYLFSPLANPHSSSFIFCVRKAVSFRPVISKGEKRPNRFADETVRLARTVRTMPGNENVESQRSVSNCILHVNPSYGKFFFKKCNDVE